MAATSDSGSFDPPAITTLPVGTPLNAVRLRGEHPLSPTSPPPPSIIGRRRFGPAERDQFAGGYFTLARADCATALAECASHPRRIRGTILSRTVLGGLMLFELTASLPLVVADLTVTQPASLPPGTLAAVSRDTEHDASCEWTADLRHASQEVQGIIWPSVQFPDGQSLLLFADRLDFDSAFECPPAGEPILGGRFEPIVRQLAARRGWVIR